MNIKNVIAREILDSRGNPTIEVDVVLENDITARFSVPSGASTGSREALELRDGNSDRFLGLGVSKAVDHVNHIIKDYLIGIDVSRQDLIDAKLNSLDNTVNKSKLGANAILGVSGAVLRAAAMSCSMELFRYVGSGEKMPILMVNIINGGRHADNHLSFQEFMIVPIKDSVKESIRVASEIFHCLKKILKEKGFSTAVGDEGGFAPDLKNNYEALDLIIEAIKKAGYEPSTDVKIALDVAASELYNDGYYNFDDKVYTKEELIHYYCDLIDKYPIISIEDPVFEDDFDSFSTLTKLLGDRVQLVGDDLFVTNKKFLQKGIDYKAGNAILIKPNQIGTITEMIETINLAKNNNYNLIMSHRSGETEDTTIADLAVGLGTKYIKTGSMSRGERICKYNRLIRIEESIHNLSESYRQSF